MRRFCFVFASGSLSGIPIALTSSFVQNSTLVNFSSGFQKNFPHRFFLEPPEVWKITNKTLEPLV